MIQNLPFIPFAPANYPPARNATAVGVVVIFFLLTSASPVLRIHSPDGDVIECVRREEQPTFQHDFLKHHKIEEPPMSDLPIQKKARSWQIWHQNGTICPEGSIPIRELRSHLTGLPVLKSEIERLKDTSKPKIYGTQATMNVWNPKVEGANEFSLGQIWLTTGSYDTLDLNSIEAGWQIYPRLYGDSQPRFFVYWTADAYRYTGGYNLRKGGFVQVSRTVVIEGAIAHASVFGGIQGELTIRMWKDPKLGSWWLGVILDGTLEPVGYWPALLFTRQVDFAGKVEWGGEIVNTNPFGRHTATQMGSGYFPDSGIGKVAYMRDLQVALSENIFEPLRDLAVDASNPDYYRSEKVNNTQFNYGGSTQLKSVAISVTFDWLLVCLSFLLLLLI